MAKAIWGKVYYQDVYAGLIQREPDGRHVFTYDPSYISSEFPAIALSLPKQREPFLSETGLHPFFDNLVAEGWLQKAQARALKVSSMDHLALLLGFGHDLPGAVSIVDPDPQQHEINEHADNLTKAVLRSQASLSGVQQKLLVVQQGDHYRPVVGKELSSHIAKLPSNTHPDIVEVEYLTTLAITKLLPEDSIVTLEIVPIPSICEKALIVKRFDRTSSGKRIHFEEFNQLLNHPSGDSKYEGSYEDMGHFIQNTTGCIRTEAFQLFKRILAALLVGNTDAHFKNFAMFHTREGLRLTPAYDLVAAAKYKQYQTIALKLDRAENLKISLLKPKHILKMGYEFGLSETLIVNTVNDLGKRLEAAKAAIAISEIGDPLTRKELVQIMEKRWKVSFDSIGQYLSKKQSKGVKPKNLRNDN